MSQRDRRPTSIPPEPVALRPAQQIRGGSTRQPAADVEVFLNIEEVAALLRVKVTTIRWLRQEGRFVPATRVGRRLVWSMHDVQTWALSHREDVPA